MANVEQLKFLSTIPTFELLTELERRNYISALEEKGDPKEFARMNRTDDDET